MTLDDVRGRAVISVYPELAELLNVSKNTAYRLASEGTVPTLRLGRKLVCPVPALLRWLGDEANPAADDPVEV